MTTEQGVAFLQALRAKNIRVKENGWIECNCVLARWTHKHHTDHSPSFGLSITPGGRSYYLCFACRQGTIEELLHTLELYDKTGDYDFARCHQLLAEETFVVSLPEFEEFQKNEQIFEEWPQYWVDSFQHVWWISDAMDYLTNRGVSTATMKGFDLRYDPKRQMVVAPYRDVYHRLAGARGRTIGEGIHKHFDYTYQGINNARLVWYHEEALNLHGPVVVVEGQFDVFRVVEVFPKVIAALTSKPSFEKMKKLGDCGTVIQIPDRDDAGHQSISVYAKFCKQLGLKHVVVHLDEGVKDAGECHPDYLKERIEGALNCT